MRPTPKLGRALLQLGHALIYPTPPQEYWEVVSPATLWSGDCGRCGIFFDGISFADADSLISTHVCDPSQRSARRAVFELYDPPPRPGREVLGDP